jgi:hypothetical protein
MDIEKAALGTWHLAFCLRNCWELDKGGMNQEWLSAEC